MAKLTIVSTAVGMKNRMWRRLFCTNCRTYSNERGIALITVILLILVLSFIGAAAIVTSTTELQIGGNFKTSVQAFYNAEAGVQFALAQLKNKKSAGTLTLTGSTPVVHYTAPNTSVYPLLSGNIRPFSNWTTIHLTLKPGTTNYYTFPVTGYYSNASASVKAELHPGGSGLIPPGISATNGISTGNTFSISGGVVESATTITGSASSNANAHAGATVTVDPLGAAGLVSAHNYSASNNNAAAGIAGNSISGNKTLGPGNYYVTTLTNANLTINGTGAVNIYVNTDTANATVNGIIINSGSGPLTIYYNGTKPFTLGNNTDINKNGSASNFSFISDTAATLDFTNNLEFSGFVYAPFSNVIIGNSASFTGTLAAKTITAGNSFAVTYSPPNATMFPGVTESGTPSISSWKQM